MKKILLFSLLTLLIMPTVIFAQAATKEDIESLRKDIEGLRTYIDLKIEAVNARIDANGARIDALNTKIDEVAKRLDSRIDEVAQRLDGRIDGLDGRIDSLGDKIDMVNDKVNYLFGFLGLLVLIIAIPPIADKMAWWRKRKGARLMAAIRELSRDELAELKDMLNKV
ncbi:MAG: hypothetical protein ACUVXI_08595 [bacterium]